MKIAAVCVTYNRPKQLGRMIRCFERQDYPDRELVILDDAWQYPPASGNGWTLTSTSVRFPTLGEKRNAAIAMASPDVEAIAVWDDDDLYLPWALSATVAALVQSDLSRPSIVLHPDKRGWLHQHETGGLFHSGWGYLRQMFLDIGGYPAEDNGEDQSLLRRMIQAGIESADPMSIGFRPFLVYPWETTEKQHFSAMGKEGYQKVGTYEIEKTNIDQWIADPPKIDLGNPLFVAGLKPRKF